MAIHIQECGQHPEEDVTILSTDADLIKQIGERCGRVAAIRVTRWLTKCGLLTANKFVDDLVPLLDHVEFHHIDGDPKNNLSSNLRAVPIAEHRLLHRSDR